MPDEARSGTPPPTSAEPRRERILHLHATIAHFPIALFSTALALWVAGLCGLKEKLGPSIVVCTFVAVAAVPLAAATGFISYRRYRSRSNSGIFHAKVFGAALLCVAGLAALGPELKDGGTPLSFGVGLAIGVWLVSALAHLGGRIVHRRMGLERTDRPTDDPGRAGPLT